MSTLWGVASGEKEAIKGDRYIASDESVDLSSYKDKKIKKSTNTGILDSIKKAFASTPEEVQEGMEENIFAKGAGLNIFVSNVIDDKQDIIESLSKILDDKLDSIDSKLYKIDEIIDKFAKCKTENEQLKSKVNSLRDENYVLKNELKKFSRVIFGIFLKK